MTYESSVYFLVKSGPELGLKLWQQFYLVGLSTAVALLVGIPLGVYTARLSRMKTIILSSISTLWTIPSLALLAFLIPFFGIGMQPAILALSLYALLPILRNTVAGIEGVPAASIEAANGLGFSAWQRLWMVEMPLALPVIITGVRTAVSISVGVATLAAFIGAGGLGDFINRGLAMNSTPLILLGAIPAAAMALILDTLIGKIEKIITNRKVKQQSYKRFKIASASFVVILCSGLLGLGFMPKLLLPYWNTEKNNTVRIATKNFTEQYILGELMAQMLEAKTHLNVERKFNLGATGIVQAALVKGDVDMYPEYTGTAFLTVLHMKHPDSPKQVFQTVKRAYLKRYHLLWLPSFGFSNSQAITVKQKLALQYNLDDISDLRAIEKQIILGAPAAFISREDGLIGLKRVYKLNFGEVKQMDPGIMYKAIANNSVNAINAFTTDGRIPAYHLLVLKDNKHFYPPYDAAIVIREHTLKQHPEIRKALQPLFGLIDDKTMQQLNYAADIEKESPAKVARKFLLNKGLL